MRAVEGDLRVVAKHALAWLVAGNLIGTGLAVLLLLPEVNTLLGEWTYGRWMMVHMNVLLYGWCGVPMLGFLFHVYRIGQGPLAAWMRPVVWLWSAALAAGAMSWLGGESSGKLFLDWSGFARVLIATAMAGLWLLLAAGFVAGLRRGAYANSMAIMGRAAGLAVLCAVPFAVYVASSPNLYPAINPDSGGPTGASQLESTLGIVVILLLLPLGLTVRKARVGRVVGVAWIVLLAQGVFCALLGRGDASHHAPEQYLGLATVVLWVPLVPAYYRAFTWSSASQRWRSAFLWWWGGLVMTGCAFFFPSVLDRFKFTDGLVGHSLTAVAGFLTALLIFALVELGGEERAWIFNRTWSYYAWNVGVLAYVVLMTATGWMEGADPAFTIAPGAVRNVLYTVRLLTGLAMLAASVEWLRNAVSAVVPRRVAETVAGARAA
jgi:cytochrome c oxidase cbb3-type subunit I